MYVFVRIFWRQICTPFVYCFTYQLGSHKRKVTQDIGLYFCPAFSPEVLASVFIARRFQPPIPSSNVKLKVHSPTSSFSTKHCKVFLFFTPRFGIPFIHVSSRARHSSSVLNASRLQALCPAHYFPRSHTMITRGWPPFG